MIKINNVSYQYKGSGSPNLKNIDLEIADGETVLLCGASGCGKTTLTRLINGLIPHYYKGELSGEITVKGCRPADKELYELAGTVGSVFQNPRSQFFSIGTDGEIVFGPENIGIPPEEIMRRKNSITAEMRLEPLLGRSLFALSGGEKQKIACASVAALLPGIMLLDEPSSNLDWRAIEELRRIIGLWKQQKKTVIISEHRLWYLKDLADRVIFMRDGEIVRQWDRKEFAELSEDDLRRLELRPITLETKYIREFGTDIFDDGFVPENVSSFPKDAPLITLRDFYFTYERQRYLIRRRKLRAEDSASYTLAVPELKLPRGAVIGLIGKNGAGKSTLLRCLCGLEKICPGSVSADGAVYKGKKLTSVCYMVMQDVNHQLFTDSVGSEVMLSMKKQNDRRGQQDQSRQLCRELLRQMGLEQLRDKHPMALSGGQKQRVAIASALAADAKLLLFDEPTSGLDYAHMKAVSATLRRLADDGRTVIVSTHDPELIALCCDYVLCIDHGRVKYLRKA